MCVILHLRKHIIKTRESGETKVSRFTVKKRKKKEKKNVQVYCMASPSADDCNKQTALLINRIIHKKFFTVGLAFQNGYSKKFMQIT